MDRYTGRTVDGELYFRYKYVKDDAIKRFAAYEDIGKTPEEIQETLDKDNRLISQYAEENERLSNIIECLKDAIREQDEYLKAVCDAVKAVHDATIELDAVINL